MTPAPRIEANTALIADRYTVFGAIASGGMATVHLGRLRGSAGFHRIVAIKRLHARGARDPDRVKAFVDEARLAARIRHPSVVPVLDVVLDGGEPLVVLEYVHGEALHALLSGPAYGPPPIAVVAAIVRDVLEGLHAAHDAVDERGIPLEIVHRDVSPQNILVGADGFGRVLDFGIAQFAARDARSSASVVRGKRCYMAPEALISGQVTRRSDLYSAAIVLWEALVGRRLFDHDATLQELIDDPIPLPSTQRPGIPLRLERVVMRALERNPALRYASAREMSLELAKSVILASEVDVGRWVAVRAGARLEARERLIAAIEESAQPSTRLSPPPRPRLVECDHRDVTATRSFTGEALLPEPVADTLLMPVHRAPGSVGLLRVSLLGLALLSIIGLVSIRAQFGPARDRTQPVSSGVSAAQNASPTIVSPEVVIVLPRANDRPLESNRRGKKRSAVRGRRLGLSVPAPSVPAAGAAASGRSAPGG